MPGTTTPQGASDASAAATTGAPVAPSAATETKEAAATTVKPIDDISEPTGAVSESLPDLEDGWGFFSSLVFLVAVVGAGAAFWRLGGMRYAKLLFSGRERAQYRKVSPQEV